MSLFLNQSTCLINAQGGFMSTTRAKDSDKKSEYKEPDKKFKQITSAVINGANYALSASGAAGLFLTIVGLVIAVPALVILLVPAGLGLIFCGVGIYNHDNEPDEVGHKLDEIKDQIGHVREGQQHHHHNHHHRHRSAMPSGQDMEFKGLEDAVTGRGMEHKELEVEHKGREAEHKGREAEHKGREAEHKGREAEHKGREAEHKVREAEHHGWEVEHKRREAKHHGWEMEHKEREVKQGHGEVEHKKREIGIQEFQRNTATITETESTGCCPSVLSIFSRKSKQQVAIIEERQRRASVVALAPERMVMDDMPVRVHASQHRRG
jgi:hypothetical protein